MRSVEGWPGSESSGKGGGASTVVAVRDWALRVSVRLRVGRPLDRVPHIGDGKALRARPLSSPTKLAVRHGPGLHAAHRPEQPQRIAPGSQPHDLPAVQTVPVEGGDKLRRPDEHLPEVEVRRSQLQPLLRQLDHGYLAREGAVDRVVEKDTAWLENAGNLSAAGRRAGARLQH